MRTFCYHTAVDVRNKEKISYIKRFECLRFTGQSSVSAIEGDHAFGRKLYPAKANFYL